MSELWRHTSINNGARVSRTPPVDAGETTLEGLANLDALIPAEPQVQLEQEATGLIDANVVRDWRAD
jgi:hypothetical protein